MIIDLSKVNDKVFIDEDFFIDLDVYKNKDIKSLENLHVKGCLFFNVHDNLEVSLNIAGKMVLLDSVTLELIEYPLNIEIEDEIDTNSDYFKKILKKTQNTLDIKEILWENIVLEVPIRITNTNNFKLSGDGWSMGLEKEENNIDPRLSKLKEFLEK